MNMPRTVIEVIDDNEDIRRMLALVLATRGYEVRMHSGGQAYLDAERSQPPHIMLLDVRMPGMSGLELLARLKERGDRIPVIFMSGESQPHEIEATAAGGAVHFLWKPFNTQQLFDSVALGLQSSQASAGA